MKISFDNLLKSSCLGSQNWLMDNRSKGLRWIVKAIMENKCKAVANVSIWPITNIVSPAVDLTWYHPEIEKAVNELHLLWNEREHTAQEVIDILDKYQIDDVFTK
jgi:hypothetical protein